MITDVIERAGRTFLQAFFATFLTLIGTAFSGVSDLGTLKSAAGSLFIACIAAALSAVFNLSSNKLAASRTAATITTSTTSDATETDGTAATDAPAVKALTADDAAKAIAGN